MALSMITWSWFSGLRSNGCDLHVLRNQPSHSLVNEVAYGETVNDLNWWFSVDHAKSKAQIKKDSLEFAPLFPNVTKFGITIDKATGTITAGAPTGGVTIHNFLLGAKATLTTGAVIGPTLMRVHVHDRVRRCWLTPSPLTIYRGGKGQRFTVLAELETDGQPDPPLIGDLSWTPGITWTATPIDPAVTSTGITFGARGEILTTSATPLGNVKITAKLPAHLGGREASETVEVVLGFDEQPQRNYQAILRSGPGSARVMEVPNILLLSEGFTSDQVEDWDTLVEMLVDDLAHTKVFRPFDLFVSKGSVNIWSLFLPSRHRGSSLLYELRTMPGNAAWPRATEGIPRSRWNPKTLDIGSALHQLGLPVRSDALPADDAAQKAAATAKFAEWNKITGWNLDPTDPVRFSLWQAWTGWSTRTLADERDTALGIAFGGRPNNHAPKLERGPAYHPFRTHRDELDKLLAKLTDGEGPLIGQVWGPGGKDRTLVVALIGGGRWGGEETSGDVTAASIHDDWGIRVDKLEDPAKSLRVAPVPNEMPRSKLWGLPKVATHVVGTIVHEISHAFGLGDEYVEDDQVGKFSGGSGSPNLTGESEFVDPAHVPPPNTPIKLVGDKLHWHWPRISRAAILSDSPWLGGSNASTEIVIPLRRGAKFMFKNGDVVFLRRRPLRGPVDGKLVIAEPSAPLVVTSDNQVGDQIVVRTQDGSDLKVAEFPSAPGREPILFVAVPPPAYAAAEKFANIIPPVVRDYITKTGLPLNRNVADKCDELDNAKRAALTNVPDTVDPFWVTRRWVGAFDGGSQFPCGIFHPSPECIMGQSIDTTLFCPVCRYVLVDAVDPSLHGDIDKDYALGYVEPA